MANGKGDKVGEKVKEAWKDTYSSDQPLGDGMAEEQYAAWCEEGQPGRDLIEASFRPSKYFVGSMCGWMFKTGEAGTGYYRNGVQYLSLSEQVPSMKRPKTPYVGAV